MPDISIIVPIYNAEKYIKICLDSLINQTKKELEFILINDGSTDNTEKIIKKYKDPRIKYYKNKNQGIGKTRNFGIEKSTGKYIMFLDSDDSLEKNACELLFNEVLERKIDLLVFGFSKCSNITKTEEKIPSFSSTSLKKDPSLITSINLSPWNKIYKTSLIKNNNIRFIEDLKYEDVPFVIMALDKAQNISKLDKCLYNYVIHGNSETTIRDERVFDILRIIDIIRIYFQDKDYIQEELKKLIVRMITNYTIQQRYQEDMKTGIKFINEAFSYLAKYIPDYKNNKYYKDRGIAKRTIEKNRILTIIYCQLYRLLH